MSQFEDYLLKMIQQKARDFNHGMNADLNILQQLH